MPYTDIVHEVDAAAQDIKCPTAYSPAGKTVEANVKGWILLLAQPCCKLLAVPEVVVPVAHVTAREALARDANEVLFPNE